MTKYVSLKCNTFKSDLKPEKVKKVKKKYYFKKKPTGEKEMFENIWEERGPYSQIDGSFLGEFNISLFAHILPKGQNKYPKFKLNSDNCYLMNIIQHHNWDNARHKCTGPEWDLLYQKEAILKEQYKIMYPDK